MASPNEKTNKALKDINSVLDINVLVEKIKNKKNAEGKKDSFPTELMASASGMNDRLRYLESETGKKLRLPILDTLDDTSSLEGNIENFVGMSSIPTGVIGPLHVIGTSANGDFFVPLATTEGALVASYHRGAKATRLCGGITSVCLVEGVQRSPVFKFKDMGDLAVFLLWVLKQNDLFTRIINETSRFAKLLDTKTNIEGNHLILTFEYSTGDASGQNMVTICTDAICKYIVEHAPVKPIYWFIEGNYSGDKKATALSFTNVRGKKVTAEVELSAEVVNKVLKTTPEAMAEYWQTSTIGVIQTGAIGAQGHFANGLAALFIATGQDAACVSEAAVGITRMELTKNKGLYATVTLPNVIVGTVGGGTALPTQRECLELMNCYGPNKARKLSEICGAMVLAGELSIAAALSAGHFSSAHKKFGRKQTEKKV